MIQTGLSEKQVTNWFICERARRHDAAECSYSGEAVAYLHDWYEPHESHPFPTEEEKMEIAAATELNEAQIDVWLESERVRRGDAKKTHRLPLSSIKVLKDWLELTVAQVSGWLANERSKHWKATGKAPLFQTDKLPKEAVYYLKDAYASKPYPKKAERASIAEATGPNDSQIKSWLVRRRQRDCSNKEGTTEKDDSNSNAV